MSDDHSLDRSSDRLVEPASEPDGGGAEVGATGAEVAVDGEQLLLDIEGNPVRELDLDRPDELAGSSATVRQLAVDEQVWRFGHVIVDEAQDLTPMQWRMVVRRSRRGAVTILGDLAQRSIGRPGQWGDHLPPEFADHEQKTLTINYRSPAEINDLAAAALEQLVPGVPPSRAVRRAAHPPCAVRVEDLMVELPTVVSGLLASRKREDVTSSSSLTGVIGFDLPVLELDPRLRLGCCRVLSPWQAKGLEFDSVVVVEPARFLDEPNGMSLLFVALTRSTDRLVVVHQRPLPDVLAGLGEMDNPASQVERHR
jgi:hypothetical protein